MSSDTHETTQIFDAEQNFVRPFEAVDVAEEGQQDKQFYSVTTILKALSSPGLEYWAIKQAAMAAIDSQATWSAMLDDQGRDETVKWLCGARYRRPKLELGADQLGTVVHKVCETYALSGEKPDREWCADLVASHAAPTVNLEKEVNTVGKMLNQFDRWLQRFTPSYTAAEMAVYSEQYGYAGSLDAILTLDGVRLITDYKTRREPMDAKGNMQTPYGETALQLAAYRHADLAAVWRARRVEKWRRRYYLLSPDEKEIAPAVPQVDGGLCIIITPESCEAFPMRVDEEVFNSFLYTFEAWRWSEEISKRVVGDALVEGRGTPTQPADQSA
jgi:PD-(D/E)XK nuclease superfamily